MTDAEYLWEPVTGCWTLRRISHGVWKPDLGPNGDTWTPVSPPPVTTIAWRMWHLGASSNPSWPPISVRSARAFAAAWFDEPSQETATGLGTAKEDIDAVSRHWAAFSASVDLFDDDELRGPIGEVGGPFGESSIFGLVVHSVEPRVRYGDVGNDRHMAEIGCFLSSEEHGPRFLLDTASQAEEAGFRSVFISDHYHPWTERQGESPFVWSVIGAIAATTDLRVMTGVTCPTMRVHPAVLAQAAATSQLLLDGRFTFGVGSGEALNEHILGQRWPPTDVRLEMLEEAIEIMRLLWRGGTVNHHGRYYTVENARIYSLPHRPPPIVVSGFGAKSTMLAARIGDGYVTTAPDADSVQAFRHHGGTGPAIAALKVCWDRDESTARKLAFEQWPTTCVPGELSQELPTPEHFEQASQNVTEDMVAEKIACGPDPERHLHAIRQYVEAGFDEIYVSQVGDDQVGFFDFYARELRPRLEKSHG